MSYVTCIGLNGLIFFFYKWTNGERNMKYDTISLHFALYYNELSYHCFVWGFRLQLKFVDHKDFLPKNLQIFTFTHIVLTKESLIFIEEDKKSVRILQSNFYRWIVKKNSIKVDIYWTNHIMLNTLKTKYVCETQQNICWLINYYNNTFHWVIVSTIYLGMYKYTIKTLHSYNKFPLIYVSLRYIS